jgi:hypothetical protein
MDDRDFMNLSTEIEIEDLVLKRCLHFLVEIYDKY